MVNLFERLRYSIPKFIAAEDWHNSDMDVVVKKGWEVSSEIIEALAVRYGMDTFHTVGAVVHAIEIPYDGLHFVICSDKKWQGM